MLSFWVRFEMRQKGKKSKTLNFENGIKNYTTFLNYKSLVENFLIVIIFRSNAGTDCIALYPSNIKFEREEYRHWLYIASNFANSFYFF